MPVAHQKYVLQMAQVDLPHPHVVMTFNFANHCGFLEAINHQRAPVGSCFNTSLTPPLA